MQETRDGDGNITPLNLPQNEDKFWLVDQNLDVNKLGKLKKEKKRGLIRLTAVKVRQYYARHPLICRNIY